MAGSEVNKVDKIINAVVAAISVVGLVVVLWLDLGAEENVPQFVYGIFGGGILGADVIKSWFKK